MSEELKRARELNTDLLAALKRAYNELSDVSIYLHLLGKRDSATKRACDEAAEYAEKIIAKAEENDQ